jgi:hypothetical protein
VRGVAIIILTFLYCWTGTVSAQPLIGIAEVFPLFDGPAAGEPDGTGGSDTASDEKKNFLAIVKPSPQYTDWSSISNQKHIDWSGVFSQSSVFLAIEHGYRIATEAGTREGMKGPFLKNYWSAASNLHGWADGDEFYVNYVGHPMQGAVSGYILIQNDIPAYRYATFGKNRQYWNSRLRAMAYAYLYSVQFEIGALSEASLGKVQAYFPQQGFVDHVVTPTVGLGWIVAEDALDKYVVTRLENRFQNTFVTIMARGWLNPSRSFANMMKFEVPWHRDTRTDPHDPSLRREAIVRLLDSGQHPEYHAISPERANAAVAPFEFDLTYQMSRYGSSTTSGCLGGSGTAAVRLGERWQGLLDVGGCKLRGMDTNWSGDSLHYLAGVRWTPWASGKWSLHTQVLGGGEKMSDESMFPAKKAALYQVWQSQGSNPLTQPTHDQYTISNDTNGFSVQSGAGVSYRINSALQLRVASIDYRHSWLRALDGQNYSGSFNFSTGLTLRMGTW